MNTHTLITQPLKKVEIDMKTNTQISIQSSKAISRYGERVCLDAHASHREGNGANTVSWEVMPGKWSGRTRSAEAAINAGRELSESLAS